VLTETPSKPGKKDDRYKRDGNGRDGQGGAQTAMA